MYLMSAADIARVMSATAIPCAVGQIGGRGTGAQRGGLLMRVFVTGASGWVGSAVVPELVNTGHHVVGLARSEASADALAAAGAEGHRGSLEEVRSLRGGAAKPHRVIQLAFMPCLALYEAAHPA